MSLLQVEQGKSPKSCTYFKPFIINGLLLFVAAFKLRLILCSFWLLGGYYLVRLSVGRNSAGKFSRKWPVIVQKEIARKAARK